jgi:thioredoxin 2
MAEFADADRASPDAAEPNPAAVCAVCGGASRVPAADRARDARCGHCRAPLLAGRPQAVRTGRWRRVVLGSEWPVLTAVIDPTRPLGVRWMASLAESSAALAGRAQVLLLRADLDPEAGASSGLGALPGLLLLSGGRLVSGLCGGLEPDPLEDWFTQALAAHRQS